VEAEDFPFEGFQAAGGGLDQEQMFASGFDFSFPAVDGFERGGMDVDARGQVFLEEGAGDFAGFGEGGAGYEDETELGGGGHGIRVKIVTDLDLGGKERGKITQRRGERREDEGEEDLWRWIVRAQLSQKARRIRHPQVFLW
jgi:hypothetical protein